MLEEAEVPEVLPYEVRRQCEVGDYNYNLTATCEHQLQYWIGSRPELQPGDNCMIDPKTKVMDCERKASCQGGEPYQHNVNYMVYPCGRECEGTLLIDCCQTCAKFHNDPSLLGVREVMCEGCESENLVAVADAADCSFDGSVFNCKQSSVCDIGKPQHEKSICLIYPCDRCDYSIILKQQCCQECLELMCEIGSNRRMVCKGCEAEATITSSGGGGFFWALLSLLAVCVVMVFACFIVTKKKKIEDEDEEEEAGE